MTDRQAIRLAYRKIDKSECIIYKVCAVLVKGRNVCSIGVNQPKTHPEQKDQYHDYVYGKSIHAELDCLIRAPYETITGSTIYVCRKLHNGDFALAKPCHLCQDLLRKYGVKKAIYSIGPTEMDLGIIEFNMTE